MVQWLRLRTSTAGGVGSIPGQGTKIPRAMRHGQKNFFKKTSNAAQHPTMHWTVPTTGNYLIPNVSSAKAKKNLIEPVVLRGLGSLECQHSGGRLSHMLLFPSSRQLREEGWKKPFSLRPSPPPDISN